MIAYGSSPPPRAGAPRTGPVPGAWRRWQTAWAEAAYGSDGFWTRERPRDHFATGVGAGTLVARAVAALVPDGVSVVVDVGAGDGALLDALAGLLPGVALVGVDRRPRPDDLDPGVAWVVDHLDVDGGRWTGGGPGRWCAGRRPLLVAHEWLDDLPAPVVERVDDGWREIEVAPDGTERLGAPVSAPDATWLARWWDVDGAPGVRAEVGRSRDAAWGELVAAALAGGGRALAVDYGHVRGGRPRGGSLVAYAGGRRQVPVGDGTVNLTAGVAVDALAAAGEARGATTLVLRRQADQLATLPDDPAQGDDGPLATLVRRSERAALTAPGRWGPLWWLLQGDGAADGPD